MHACARTPMIVFKPCQSGSLKLTARVPMHAFNLTFCIAITRKTSAGTSRVDDHDDDVPNISVSGHVDFLPWSVPRTSSVLRDPL